MSLKALAENIILRNQRCNSSEATAGHSSGNAAIRDATNNASMNKPLWTSPDEREIVAWLEHIGETDPAVFQETLNKCQSSKEGLAFFLDLARKKTGAVH